MNELNYTKYYLVDSGVIIKPGEYEFESYGCYNCKDLAFYDTNQFYTLDPKKAKKLYMPKNDKEYIVITDQGFVEKDYGQSVKELLETYEADDISQIDIENPDYRPEGIVYCAYNDNGVIKEFFIEGSGIMRLE